MGELKDTRRDMLAIGDFMDLRLMNNMLKAYQSLTCSSNPHQYIRTVAIGMNLRTKNHHNCPCSANPGYSSSFTGSDYYCAPAHWITLVQEVCITLMEYRAGCTGGTIVAVALLHLGSIVS